MSNKKTKTLDYIRTLYNNIESSDLIVKFNEKEYHLNKIILFQIPYFKANSNFINLSGKNESLSLNLEANCFSFEIILKYLYDIDIINDIKDIRDDSEFIQIFNDIIYLLDYFTFISDIPQILIDYISKNNEKSFHKNILTYYKHIPSFNGKAILIKILDKYNTIAIKGYILDIPHEFLELILNLLIRNTKTIDDVILNLQVIILLIFKDIKKETKIKICKYMVNFDKKGLKKSANNSSMFCSIPEVNVKETTKKIAIEYLQVIRAYCTKILDNL
jgi:hypothetical protein